MCMNVKEEADKLSNFSHPSTDSDHFSRLKSTTLFRNQDAKILRVKRINIEVKSTTGEWSSTCIIVVTYYPGRTLMPSPRWKKRKKGQKNEELQNHLILPLLSLCFDYYSLNSRAFLPLAPTISFENGPKMSHFPTLQAKLVAWFADQGVKISKSMDLNTRDDVG